jgi:hypothetical protein
MRGVLSLESFPSSVDGLLLLLTGSPEAGVAEAFENI